MYVCAENVQIKMSKVGGPRLIRFPVPSPELTNNGRPGIGSQRRECPKEGAGGGGGGGGPSHPLLARGRVV